MDKARYLGIKVYVWTVNEKKEMEKQIYSIEADGVMTDNPALLEQVLSH